MNNTNRKPAVWRKGLGPLNYLSSAWSVLFVFFLSSVAATGLVALERKDALAAGEVLTVSPDFVAPGARVTITVTNIASSSFCDYLPYQGDNYYATAYIWNLDARYVPISGSSDYFDPKSDNVISFEATIPGYPVGSASITVDCWTPDGQQTGNTAIPFKVDVVTKEEFDIKLAALESGGDAPNSDSYAEPDQETTESPRALDIKRVADEPVGSIYFSLEPINGDQEKSALRLQARRVSGLSDVVVQLIGSDYSEILFRIEPVDGGVDEYLLELPPVPDGTYRLEAEGRSQTSGGRINAELNLTVVDRVYVATEGQELRVNESDWASIPWLSMGILFSLSGGIILGWAWIRDSRKKS